MTDQFDTASDLEQQHRDAAIAAAHGDIPPGDPGVCDLCGEYHSRLVSRMLVAEVVRACPRCRDRRRLG